MIRRRWIQSVGLLAAAAWTSSHASADEVTVAVGELIQIEKWYSSLLGARGERIESPELGAEGLLFKAGPHRLNFLTPRTATSPLVDWLRTYGPSPYSAVLRGSDPAALDPSLTHGANLSIR